MQLGLIGLGKMGGNMAARLREKGHEVVGYDRSPDLRDVDTLAELVERLPVPRTVWLMVPAGKPTTDTIEELAELLAPGDLVIEGGNSHYVDDRRHAGQLSAKGIRYVDAGVSGGVWGRQNGYGIMVGGAAEDVAHAKPIFDALTPDSGGGYVHAGGVGAGHFVKMVHNGIEYGMMQAFAEGYELMAASDVVDDVAGTFDSWREGTVVRSWLLDLLVRALEEDPELEGIRGYAQDSGEGRWTVQAAVDHAVPAPVITAALFARFASRQDDSPAMKVVAALRNQFGGHAVTKSTGDSA
ncbi:phosphogluconate dehydrogenase (NAD(+)-dependent, decarboxylating) [Marinitenerispora sediminis]|uniref:Decarboxylating 6-phosphogluconate dehydrogenase n=1 Tax=Marinitenerispora sediminis TaxID=1931232 RepID=A0A368TAA5_9ACTN|nr:decarboxylating 6-phosphogluconate dehydrogenase [Marinitenerispora sediminis]RCV53963.1 decarboxylating 6-phosphogluconate dehydrogenase [Marinitenerispora sediminis]RCV60486.1 decarboxylating 6-phosphogluconate dehydrogenase [Marinitenerispora sediminis]RCV61833.1 decarboxylating 6-phosphogluconate dehydrogenase [Marinitenerispora sediminis]